MAAVKRTNAQREEDLVSIANLHTRGYSSRDIAARLRKLRPYSLSWSVVARDIRDIHERWRNEILDSVGALRARELHCLGIVQLEAFAQWEESKNDRRRVVTERDGKTRRKIAKETVTVEGQCGDPRYLSVVLECIAQRAKLLGLEAPKQWEHTGRGGGPLQVKTTTTEPIQVRITKYESVFQDADSRAAAATPGVRP